MDSRVYCCTVQNLVGMEDCELILKITSPSTVTDGHGPIAGSTAEITAGVIDCAQHCNAHPSHLQPPQKKAWKGKEECLSMGSEKLMYLCAQKNRTGEEGSTKEICTFKTVWSFPFCGNILPYSLLHTSLQLRCEEEDDPYERNRDYRPCE